MKASNTLAESISIHAAFVALPDTSIMRRVLTHSSIKVTRLPRYTTCVDTPLKHRRSLLLNQGRCIDSTLVFHFKHVVTWPLLARLYQRLYILQGYRIQCWQASGRCRTSWTSTPFMRPFCYICTCHLIATVCG